MPAGDRCGLRGMPGWCGCTSMAGNKEEVSPPSRVGRIQQRPADGTLRSPRSAR